MGFSVLVFSKRPHVLNSLQLFGQQTQLFIGGKLPTFRAIAHCQACFLLIWHVQIRTTASYILISTELSTTYRFNVALNGSNSPCHWLKSRIPKWFSKKKDISDYPGDPLCKGSAWGGPLKVTIQCHHNSNLHPLVQTHAPLSKSGFYEMQSQLWTIKLLHWGKWKIFFLVPLRSFEFTTVIHDLKFRF